MVTVAQKKKFQAFARRWEGRGYEKGETAQFWLDLLGLLGYEHTDSVLFEHHLANGGFIDVWLRDAGVIVEQKALGVDLDKPELRQGVMKTPLEQALHYADDLPRLSQPRWVMTCNFATFRVYDRDSFAKSQLAANGFEFTLDELAEHPEYLAFVANPTNAKLEKEKQVSIQAGELIARLYDHLREGYLDPDSDETMHALNVLCVRLVFCLYCEDAGLFEKDAFLNYLRDVQPMDVRGKLRRLFRALDTPLGERDPYDLAIKQFPYVNGGLFHGEYEVPNFDGEMKRYLLDDVSAAVDWSEISPTIFGGIFESTLNPETRRAGGMHYTTVEAIHKVIDPLFMDALKAEFTAIRDTPGLTPRQRKSRYARLHAKMCTLTFLDPACGSGNFLTETYLSLRQLEDAVLMELRGGQAGFGFGENADAAGQRVSLSQFYGIEINDFAVTVAEAALWISRLKANGETSMLLDADDDFPLTESAHIVHANALRKDWADVLAPEACSYVIGNPPFVGYSYLDEEQKKDRLAICGKGSGFLDYVACWYFKAADYVADQPIRCALVSTNSICQGLQVDLLWRPLFESGVRIDFCWRTFVWNSEATDQAHVHCVIVGFSRLGGQKTIHDSDGVAHAAGNINGYLLDAPSQFISKRSKPLCDMPPMAQGHKPAEHGCLLLSAKERDELVAAEPGAERWIRPFSMGAEFINGQDRYCLWLHGITDEELDALPLVKAHVDACRAWREAQVKTGDAYRYRTTPHLFKVCNYFHDVPYIGIPSVSSGRREYVPMGFVTNGMIPGNQLYFVEADSIYMFGVMQSQFHNAWMRVVAGRLKNDYRYSNTIVYNNFVWPDATEGQRGYVEECAQAVLDARAGYPSASLSDLYDPDKMPDDLLAAHKALDAAVEVAYGVDFGGDETRIVSHLFGLYAEKTRES